MIAFRDQFSLIGLAGIVSTPRKALSMLQCAHSLASSWSHDNNGTVSRQMPRAGNIAKTMTSNRKQFTITREMLTAVALDQRSPDVSCRWNLSTFFKIYFVLFCYITKHLMTGPLGNSEFCFPRISMFPSNSSWKILRFSGNKMHCFPRDQSLSVNCFIQLY